jgi:hypothetical protein
MHPAIMMRHRFEMADRAGQVSRLALWSLRGSFAGRSGRGCGSALSESVVEPEFVKFGHRLFSVLKCLFLSAF